MKMIIIGPQGSGKGTYSSRIGPKLGVPHISSGDILRENVKKQTPLGIKAKEYMDRGELVPDEIVIGLLKERFGMPDCKEGFILDGFPRNLIQAKELEDITHIELVLNLDVPEWILLKRLGGRVTCKECKEIYNLDNMKPKQEGICDRCGGELIQRDDDKPEAIKKRLNEYEDKTKPLIDYYKGKSLLKTVSCTKFETPPEEMIEKIIKIIEEMK